MKVLYENVYDPGEGEDMETETVKKMDCSDKVNTLIDVLTEFVKDHPNARFDDGPFELILIDWNEDIRKGEEMIISVEK